MGLDLYLTYKKKSEEDYTWDDDSRDLSYGRKTWSIYYKFKELGAVPQDEYKTILKITPEVYEQFILSIFEAMDAVGVSRKKLRKDMKYIDRIEMMDDCSDQSLAKLTKAWAHVDEFLSTWTDVTATLGGDWEVGVILNWLEQREMVRTIFEDPDNEVYLIASY